MPYTLPNNPGNLQNGPSFSNSAVDVLANDQALLAAINTHEASTNGAHGISSGAIVGTEALQTLTNKTLTAPVLGGNITGTYTLAGTPTITSPAIKDTNGNELLSFAQVASAVNEFTIRNGAAGTAASLEATGGDTNINILLAPKGTGVVKHGTATLHREDGTVEDSYSTQINLGGTTTGAFADVDTTNMSLSFTVNVPGKYFVTFVFSHNLEGADATGRVFFKLTDGTNDSAICLSSSIATDPSADSVTFEEGNVITISHVFTFATTGSKTVKLQYRNQNMSGSPVNLVNPNLGVQATAYMCAFRVSN